MRLKATYIQRAISRTKVLAVLCIMSMSAWADTPDSTYTLSAKDYMSMVLKYHPVAKQADLLTERAKAELLIARGNWDPLISSDYNRKTFDGKNYYSLFESSLKVPLWIGEVKAGYDYYYGINLNPQNKIPAEGLSYFGISLPVLKDLITDKKRTGLRQAKIFREASEQQRLDQLNDLLYEALSAYWNWAVQSQSIAIHNAALNNATLRLNYTKKLVEFGDRPAIDSIEALTQVQTRQFQLNETMLMYNNSALGLSNFLWYENDEPFLLPATAKPTVLDSLLLQTPLTALAFDELLNNLAQTHPALAAYRFKISQLKADLLLKKQNILPTLNAQYNILSKELDFFRNPELQAVRNNYKFGVTFVMPITFAQSRCELKLARLKIMDAKYSMELKTLELTNKLKSYYNEVVTLRSQTELYIATIQNFQRLYDGEDRRFKVGESSMFLVNSRENKLIETQLKLIELQGKYQKSEAGLKWSAGKLTQP